tara:strand:+ start:256226 stop:257095 length:870 start_codon:yes stop_codon:yes gene_type:complete
VLITGAGGQLGRELLDTAGDRFDAVALGHADCDIGDAQSVAARLREHSPQVVINAAAYTAVDKAESEPQQALRVNAVGAENLAIACAQLDIRLLHISTDFVFAGTGCQPYKPDAAADPLGEYGRSKLAGEVAVSTALPAAVIVRTGWLYARRGHNFVHIMLRLMREREVLQVVDDQIGTPTCARGLAQALWTIAERPQLRGIYHWSDAGVCSWYDFAVAIAEEAQACGLLPSVPLIQPVPSSAYPTPASRPAYSVLDKSATWRDLACEGQHWRKALRTMLQQLKDDAHD